jgi:hypothetical protein
MCRVSTIKSPDFGEVLTIGKYFSPVNGLVNRLCGLVVRVLGYRSGGPGSIPGTTKK